RVRWIEGQLQLLRGGAVPGHRSWRRAADAGAHGDSRYEQPRLGLRILLILFEPHDAAKLDLGNRDQSLSDSGQPGSAAGVRAGRGAGLSVGKGAREPVRAELLQRAGTAGNCRREYRLPDCAVQPLLDSYFQSGPRWRPDLQRRRVEG